MASLRSDIFSLFGARGVGVLIPFLAVPYLTRMLSPSGFGIYAAGLGISAVMLMLVKFGFDMSSYRDGALVNESILQFRRILTETITAQLVFWGLIATTVGVWWLLAEPNQQLGMIVAVALLFTLSNALFPQWALQALGLFRASAIINVVSKLLMLLLTFTFVRDEGDVILALVFQLGWSVPAMFIAHWLIASHTRSRWVFTRITLRGLGRRIRSSMPFFFSVFFGSVYTSMNAPVMALLGAPASQVGYFAAVDQIIGATRIPADPLKQAFFGRLVRSGPEDRNNYRSLQRKFLITLLLVYAVICISVIIASERIVVVFLGPEYDETAIMVKVGVLSLIPWVLGMWAETVLQAQGLVRKSVWAPLAGATAHLIFLPYFLGEWGALGVFVTILITQSVILVVLTIQWVRAANRVSQ